MLATKQILFSGTSTGLRDLTLANVITDATRRAAVEGDGLSVPGGFGVWPAATNIAFNGGFETNTTGWGISGATSITRDATQSKFGTACGDLLHTGAAGQQQAYQNLDFTAGAYTASAWVWTNAAGVSAGANAYLGLYDLTTAFTSTPVTLTLVPQKITLTSTLLTVVGGNVSINSDTASQHVFFDGVQVETGSIATPYIETDGGTASRSAGRAQVAVQGLFTATQGAVAMRLRMGFARSGFPYSNPGLFEWLDDASNRVIIYLGSLPELTITRTALGSGTNASLTPANWSVGGDKTFIGKWSSSSIGVSDDGGAFTSAADTNIPALSDTTADIGAIPTSAAGDDQISSNIRWAITFKGTPTDADAALPWMTQNAVPTLSQIAQLSAASKPTLLIPADTSMARLLPAYFGGTL